MQHIHLVMRRKVAIYANSVYPDQKIVAIAIAAWANNTFTKMLLHLVEVAGKCSGQKQIQLTNENFNVQR